MTVPDPLAPLFAPLSRLPGIGAATSARLARVAEGERLRDLLFTLPLAYTDRSLRPSLHALLTGAVPPGAVATVTVEVVRQEAPAGPRQPWRVLVTDGTGFAEIVLFHPARLAAMPPRARLLVSGRVELFDGRLRFPHPDHVVPADRPAAIPPIEPQWPLTAGLWPRQVARAMQGALAAVPALPEWHDPTLLRRRAWPGFAGALRLVQAPDEIPPPTARERLAYDELLASQLAFALLRRRKRPGRVLAGDGRLRDAALATFGHPLHSDQARVLAEIDADFASGRRMMRLLQGDVGAGKTLVALLAMLRAAEAGSQAALMVPTELLARQHHRTLARLAPVPVALLTGTLAAAEARAARAGLADGSIPLAVGTHALFQKSVAFHDLALAVIDEQHRFGVNQRLSLRAKGRATHVLAMTATPIPRTLLLAEWGEMEVSRLIRPPGRRGEVRTTLHAAATLPAVIEGVARMLARGASIFWVCPQVAESEAGDIAAAEARFAILSARFGAAVGLAHGRMDPAAREAALAAFAASPGRLLVATTVIEVGIDIAAASVMVIDHAERFGLAQIHQLRGRVGRAGQPGFCLLLHEDVPTAAARERLVLLRDCDDGFAIADADFRLRGGGELLGTRQSGTPGWRLADPGRDEGLLFMANQDAALIAEKDPALASPRGEALRLLLRLFERRAAAKSLAAG